MSFWTEYGQKIDEFLQSYKSFTEKQAEEKLEYLSNAVKDLNKLDKEFNEKIKSNISLEEDDYISLDYISKDLHMIEILSTELVKMFPNLKNKYDILFNDFEYII